MGIMGVEASVGFTWAASPNFSCRLQWTSTIIMIPNLLITSDVSDSSQRVKQVCAQWGLFLLGGNQSFVVFTSRECEMWIGQKWSRVFQSEWEVCCFCRADAGSHQDEITGISPRKSFVFLNSLTRSERERERESSWSARQLSVSFFTTFKNSFSQFSF